LTGVRSCLRYNLPINVSFEVQIKGLLRWPALRQIQTSQSKQAG
jgi:hypothetical protein